MMRFVDIRKSLAWWLLAIAAMVTADRFWPASWWIDVGQVHVEDSVVGTPPRMKVDRTINRVFYGTWRVEIEKVSPTGGFVFIPPPAYGENLYEPQNELPDPLDLEWWGNAAMARPAPGSYRIETCWRIFPQIFSPRRFCRTSNLFEIRNADK